MTNRGFSTGALAKGDFMKGIDAQRAHPGITAIELSALRDHELPPLIRNLPQVDLSSFDYVSFHAPSRLTTLTEDDVIALLFELPFGWPVVLHPYILLTPSKWQQFGSRLCIENMDNRKSAGRTVAEMRELFTLYPKASFCLDLGHARQIDPTMAVALLMLAEFSERLVQIHVSEVGPAGEHLPVSNLAALAFRRVMHRVPAECALIIESVVSADAIERELSTVGRLLEPAEAHMAFA